MPPKKIPFKLFQLALPKTSCKIGGYNFSLINWGKVEPSVWSSSRHSHSYYEAILSYTGKGMFSHKSNNYEIQKDCWIVSAPGEEHQTISAKEDNWGIFCMYFSLTIANRQPLKSLPGEEVILANSMSTTQRIFQSSTQSLNLCQMMHKEIECQEKGFNCYLEHLSALLFLDLLRCMQSNLTTDTSPFAFHGASDEIRLQNAIRFIELNMKKNITVKDVANSVFLSERQLTRIFQKAFSESPLQIINRIKINNAIQLLSSTELSIKEISFKCGFNSQHYFMTIFKKSVGMTAGAFRIKSNKSRDFSCGYKSVQYPHHIKKKIPR